MKRSLIGVMVLLLLVAATVGTFWVTSVDTLTLYASKHDYSWESVPLANNGHSDNFWIMSANFPPLNMRGWLQFNLSGIPPNAVITGAQLRLRLWSKSPNDPASGFGDSTGRIYGVYRLTKPWVQEQINWSNQPNYTDTDHATAPVPPGQTDWAGPPLYMTWDLTAMVRDWQGGIPNDGIVIRDLNESSPTLYGTQFFTTEKVPNQSYFPRLTVQYVTLPSLVLFSGVLLAEAVAIIVLLLRSHHHPSNPKRKV